ncbi:uncharacterized protein LOC144147404 [Haemaphysalis longicornis]
MKDKFLSSLTSSSLAISVSLCTRPYFPRQDITFGEECSVLGLTKISRATPQFCNEPDSYYKEQKTDQETFTVYSITQKPPNIYLATYDTSETIWTKYCMIAKKYYSDFKIGLALYDIECEDWGSQCSKDKSPNMAGTDRIKAVADKLRKVANDKQSALTCTP